MDRTTDRQAHQVLADLADNGGGTYESGTLLPFTPKGGFAVAVGGLHLPAHDVTADAVTWALRAVTTEHETSFGGTWLNEGIVYFDAVRYFGADRRAEALACGRATGQQAIYDFAAQESIPLFPPPALVNPSFFSEGAAQ